MKFRHRVAAFVTATDAAPAATAANGQNGGTSSRLVAVDKRHRKDCGSYFHGGTYAWEA
jgi:hypothetical protein